MPISNDIGGDTNYPNCLWDDIFEIESRGRFFGEDVQHRLRPWRVLVDEEEALNRLICDHAAPAYRPAPHPEFFVRVDGVIGVAYVEDDQERTALDWLLRCWKRCTDCRNRCRAALRMAHRAVSGHQQPDPDRLSAADQSVWDALPTRVRAVLGAGLSDSSFQWGDAAKAANAARKGSEDLAPEMASEWDADNFRKAIGPLLKQSRLLEAEPIGRGKARRQLWTELGQRLKRYAEVMRNKKPPQNPE